MPIAGVVVMFVLALPASPEDALKKFVTAVDKIGVNNIASLVVGGKAKGSYLDMWKSQKTLGKESLSLKVGKVKLNGTKATVQIDSILKSGAMVSSDKQTLQMSQQMSQQKDKSWKIVPSKTRPKKGTVGILAHYAVTMLPVQRNNLHLPPADQIRYRLFNMQ
jgi:hypothetical protein